MTARVPEPAPPNQRPSRFSHLVLQTAQYDEMVAWYQTWLSAKPMLENGVVCFLAYDDEHHRLMIGKNPNLKPRDPQTAGVVHFAYAVETLEDLVNYYLRLKAADIVPHHCMNHGFTTSIYYHDPDDNEVEIQVDNFKTKESMNEWFATGAVDRNFAGTFFDPEFMGDRFRAGVPEDQIHQKDLYQ
jgi:catechol-2,3-dioxygenase